MGDATGNFRAGPPTTLFSVTAGMSTTTFGLGIPNDLALAGVQVIAQAGSDDATANPLGFKISNAGRLTVGL